MFRPSANLKTHYADRSYSQLRLFSCIGDTQRPVMLCSKSIIVITVSLMRDILTGIPK